MDRKAFKQRMQQLKSYRENNPGKGYWDFKSYEEGGEIPPTKPDIIEPIPYKGKLYTDRYGKKYTEQQVYDYYNDGTDEIDRFSGGPLVRGLKPLVDLEDAANFTPVGDAVAAYDVYDAVSNKDWTTAGLSALAILPFVPTTVKEFNRKYRGITPKTKANRFIPKVNKGHTEQAIDQYFNQVKRYKMDEADYLSDVANESNRIFEDLNTTVYRNRALQADKRFGTNYNSTYDVINDLYENDFFSLPEVSKSNLNYTARMQANDVAAKRFTDSRIPAGPTDFEFKVNVDRRGVPGELATHELNHYTDYSLGKDINPTTNNPMLSELEQSLKKLDSSELTKDKKYLRSGTEQKAYMNTLRRRMLDDGTINKIDDQVSSKMLKNYIDQLPDSDYIKKAYKEHKNISTYTKWFNSIPLLGIGALGVYRYDNTKE